MRIAYLTGRYPATSHTFITREVLALRAQGTAVDTFSIWATDAADLLSAQDHDEARATFNVLPLRPLRTLRAHLRAIRASPAAYLRAGLRALTLGRPGLRGRVLGVSWLVEAVILWDELDRRGIRHVHVHLNGTAPSVALVLTTFANEVHRGGEPWSWSMTVHGSSEFFDVYGERLADKVRSARFVICVSDFTRSQLMALVDEREWAKLRIVHCGVDPDLFAPDGRGDTEWFEILIVARLTQGKGHAVLLEALADLSARGIDVRLTVVGDGPKRADLEKLAVELGVSGRTVFAGAVAQEAIREHYRRAALFCLPSFAEGVPVVLMEAMAMCLPVVATDVMGVKELVSDEESGLLVRPGRPDLLADAIARLALDPALRRRMGAVGREAVMRDFDIRHAGEQLQAVIQETRERLLSAPAVRSGGRTPAG